jgi:glycosyltransferase involved in cell wall biosynthesis
MYEQLSAQGHELRLVFGTPSEEELKRKDNVTVTNDYCFFEKSRWFFNSKLHVLEGALTHILWADVVITEQANKHLHNYFLIGMSFLRLKSVAYWGHGQNRQSSSKTIREKLKKFLALKVDWWFAYTSTVRDYLESLGYSHERISVLNNSVDTLKFKLEVESLDKEDVKAFIKKYQISDDAHIGIFCGSLHQDKRVAFLLESAKLIKQKDPKFVLIIGGDGKDKELVSNYAKQFDFIIYLGPLHGKEKALAFKVADAFLNPGMVGLAILDAFSAGLPLFTALQTEHSPEIDYLKNGHNGLMSNLDLGDYANLVSSTFQSPLKIHSLKKNALASSNEFSIENMANNFVDGISAFLSDPYR